MRAIRKWLLAALPLRGWWSELLASHGSSVTAGFAKFRFLPHPGRRSCDRNHRAANRTFERLEPLTMLSSSGSSGTLGVLVPAYFYPGTGGPGNVGDGWAAMTAAAAQISTTAILNPFNGPIAGQADQNYVKAMTNLENAGGKVIAYIPTGYAQTDLNTVEGDANTYITQYGSLIEGFFIDEMTNDNTASDLAYYHNLYTDLKGLSAAYEIIGNPGTATDPAYLATATQGADVLVTYEDDDQSQPYASTPPLPWVSSYPATDFANLIYNQMSDTTMAAEVNTAPTYNSGYVYVTDQTSHNPYGYLPAYWSTEVTAIGNSAASLGAPGLATGGPAVTYNTGGPPIAIMPKVTLYTGDGAFANSSLSATNTDSGAKDRLGVQPAGNLTVSGTTLNYSGITIGTFSGGASATPLTVSFNGNATQAAVWAVVQNITFKNVILNPSWLGNRVINVQLTDGSGKQGTVIAQTVHFSTPPVLAIGGPAANYNTGGPPIVIAPTATLTSGDGAFAKSTLTISNSDAGAYDRLGIRPSGGLTLSGTTLSYNGTTVASFQGGAASKSLIVTFNASATKAAVLAVAQNVTFANIILNPTWLTNRAIDFQLKDGEGNRGAVVVQTIMIATPPVLAIGGSAVTYVHNGPAIAIVPAATLSTGDGAFANAGLSIIDTTFSTYQSDRLDLRSFGSLAVNGTSLFYAGVSIGSYAGGNKGTLTVSFNSSASQAAVLAVLQNVTFTNVNPTPTIANRSVQFQLTDGLGNRGAPVIQTVMLA